MTGIRLTALAVLAMAAFAATDAPAQSLRAVGPPAEIPPAGYAGTQYVDSRGCVYVRAGVDGAVNWVPRVSRERMLICGQTPSVVPATAAVSASAPVIITPQAVITPRRVVSNVPQRSIASPRAVQPTRVAEERIVPKHVYDAQGETLPPVPKGYQPAWEDDRLNPHRAHMTRQGHRATQQVWSNTVPRRLLTEGQKIKEPVIVGRGKGLGH
jgi:hypothetical protein